MSSNEFKNKGDEGAITKFDFQAIVWFYRLKRDPILIFHTMRTTYTSMKPLLLKFYKNCENRDDLFTDGMLFKLKHIMNYGMLWFERHLTVQKCNI